MKFIVTKQDIAKGVRSNVNKCAVARCIARTLGLKSKDVMVNGYNIMVKDKSYQTPLSVNEFVPAFDSLEPETRAKARPFSFSLPVRVLSKRSGKQTARLVESKEYAHA